jgi:hypothetical protein
MMKLVKILLTGVVLLGAFALPSRATTIAEYEKLSGDDRVALISSIATNLLIKVKSYNPDVEKKTRAYFFEEKNSHGYLKGFMAVFYSIELTRKKHPDVADNVQIENVVKIVMRSYWKKEDITVPDAVLDEDAASPAPKANVSGQK